MAVMSAAQRYTILGALLLIPLGVAIAGYPYSRKLIYPTYIGFALGISAALIIGYVLFSTGG
jgi:hypothetical protein